MSILTFILILLMLSTLIFLHELGHFVAARRAGVRVEEFGLGYPPRIWGKKVGETIYSLNVIPLGGFVKIAGEEVEDENQAKNEEKDPGSFISKPPKTQAFILIAGIIMNTLVAIVLFYIFFFINGFKTFYIPLIFDYKFAFGTEHHLNTVIFDFPSDSPAKNAGMLVGDAITNIDGVEVNNVTDIRKALSGKAGKQVTIQAIDIKDRSYKIINTYEVTPKPNVSVDSSKEGDTVIGIYTGDAVSISYDTPLEKILSGPMQSYNLMAYSLFAFGKIIGVSVATHSFEPVSGAAVGPVGVFNILGGVFKQGGPKLALSIIDTLAVISLGFAFSNILPIPALDGGRIAFKVYEIVTKRKVKPSFEAKVHMIGMWVLLGLMLLITLKDLSL